MMRRISPTRSAAAWCGWQRCYKRVRAAVQPKLWKRRVSMKRVALLAAIGACAIQSSMPRFRSFGRRTKT